MILRHGFFCLLVLLLSGAVRAEEGVGIRLVPSPGVAARRVGFTANEKIIVTATSTDGGAVSFWDVESGKLISEFPHPDGTLHMVGTSPDGKCACIGQETSGAVVYDICSGKKLRDLVGHNEAVHAVAVSRDGKTIVTGSDDRTMRLWDAATGKELKKIELKIICDKSLHAIPDAVAISPNGKFVAAGLPAAIVQIRRLEDNEVLFESQMKGTVTSIWFSDDSSEVTATTSDKTARSWNSETGKVTHEYQEYWHKKAFAISQNHKLMMICEDGDNASLLDAETMQTKFTFKGHKGEIFSTAISNDGKRVLTSDENTVRLWDAKSGKLLQTFSGTGTSISGLTQSMGRAIFGFIASQHAVLLDVEAGQLNRLKLPMKVWDLSVAKNGTSVLIGDGEQSVKVFNAATGEELAKYNEKNGEQIVTSMFSPDDKMVLTGNSHSGVKLWDRKSGQMTQEFNDWSPSLMTMSYDSKDLLAMEGRKIFVMEVETGEKKREIDLGEDSPRDISCSRDGKEVAVLLRNRTLRMFNVSTGEQTRVYQMTSDAINGIRYSGDGKRLLLTSEHGDIEIWDQAAGKITRAMKSKSEVKNAFFVAEGKRILVACENGKIEIWDAETAKQLGTITMFIDGSWAVTAADGRYDSAEKGENPNLHWVRYGAGGTNEKGGTEIFEMAKFKDKFYTRGLLAELLGVNK